MMKISKGDNCLHKPLHKITIKYVFNSALTSDISKPITDSSLGVSGLPNCKCIVVEKVCHCFHKEKAKDPSEPVPSYLSN